MGRFLSPDPIGLLGDANLFAFVNSGPLSWRDPLGLATKGEELQEFAKNPIGASVRRNGYGRSGSTIGGIANTLWGTDLHVDAARNSPEAASVVANGIADGTIALMELDMELRQADAANRDDRAQLIAMAWGSIGMGVYDGYKRVQLIRALIDDPKGTAYSMVCEPNCLRGVKSFAEGLVLGWAYGQALSPIAGPRGGLVGRTPPGAASIIDEEFSVNRQYSGSNKHTSTDRMAGGRIISREPTNGQAALDSSIRVGNGNRRIGVDVEHGEFVVLDRTGNLTRGGATVGGEFHGHARLLG